jgi:hypothetical protein
MNVYVNYEFQNREVVTQTELMYPGMTEEYLKICLEQYETFCKKNLNYGTDNIALGTTLSKPDDMQLVMTGLWLRMQDKIQRLKQLVVLGKEDVVNESVADTYQDLSVYGIIGQLVQRGKWAK